MQVKELTPKEKFLHNITNFIQTNRIFLLVLLGVIIAFIIVFAIISEISKSTTEESTILVEQVQQSFDQWSTETEEVEKQAIEEEILSEIDFILDKYPKKYAGQRALFIRGNLYFAKEEWNGAAESYALLAERFSKSYLAPVALINSAVAHEESGNVDEAIVVYESVLSKYRDVSPQTPYVLFTLGRLYESLDDSETARERYNEIINDFSTSSWTNLARNRIISLNVKE